jgi:hypothetical protein
VGFVPSNCLFWASSAFKLFEPGLRSFELSSSVQQCLQAARAWASVPRIVFFGSAVPLGCSSLGFGPSNCLFWASSAFKLFEPGLRSLELSSSGQQSPQAIRDWTPVPRIVFFGPAEPSSYSRVGSGPSNYRLRISRALELLEIRFRSLELLSSGRQCPRVFRAWTLVPRILFFGPAVLLPYSSMDSGLSDLCFTTLFIPKFWWQHTNSDAVCQIQR